MKLFLLFIWTATTGTAFPMFLIVSPGNEESELRILLSCTHGFLKKYFANSTLYFSSKIDFVNYG